MEVEIIQRNGGLFGVPFYSDDEDELDDDEEGNPSPPPPAESEGEKVSEESSDEHQEDVPASPPLPHLDMDEIRRELNGRAGRKLSQITETRVQEDDEDDEGLPARTFQVSGSVRKPGEYGF
jgi:hypothetical protein